MAASDSAAAASKPPAALVPRYPLHFSSSQSILLLDSPCDLLTVHALAVRDRPGVASHGGMMEHALVQIQVLGRCRKS